MIGQTPQAIANFEEYLKRSAVSQPSKRHSQFYRFFGRRQQAYLMLIASYNAGGRLKEARQMAVEFRAAFANFSAPPWVGRLFPFQDPASGGRIVADLAEAGLK